MAVTLRDGVVLRQVLLPYLFLQVDQWSGEENDVSWTGRKMVSVCLKHKSKNIEIRNKKPHRELEW